MIIGMLVLAYSLIFLLSEDSYGSHWATNFVWVMSAFIAAAITLIVHIAVDPQVSPARRIFSTVLDIATVTYFFFYANEYALPLYFFYLWITFGYGFRFGTRYLLFALALSLAGFGAAIFTLPYWADHRFLGIGLWVGMLVVSLYVNTLVSRLTAALEHAEQANQAKRRFISSVSHELRTPLNAIIGMADLLHSTTLTGDQADMVRSMDNASHVMLSLIEDVLDFSKIEAGKFVIENTEFDLHQLINSTIDIFKYQASERGLSLVIGIDPGVPYRLWGDPHHLRQVLVNLLSNAIKFTEKGQVVLRIATLNDAAETALLRFEVADTGIGISPEVQAKVFDIFTQADESIARRYGGTGLGTTIAKQLVDLMGGRLGLQSELGAGSVFWFELEMKKQLGPADRNVFDGMHALLVGFDKEVAADTTAILHACGIVCELADHLASALEKLRMADHGGKPCRIALFSEGLVQTGRLAGQPDHMLLRQSVDLLKKAAQSDLSVVLCRKRDAGAPIGRTMAEQAGLSATLDFPVETQWLLNAVHAAKAAMDRPAQVQAGGKDRSDNGTKQTHYTILVAEDNPTNSKVIEKILERAGYRCTLVCNGEEALDLLGQQDFNAIILDMNMPVMNGPEAVKAYRFMRPSDTRAPIIMFSANVTKEARDECLRAGVDAFLPKPIQVSLFLETLARLIEKFEGSQKERLPYRTPSVIPILAQPSGGEIILNYATLAELENIGQDRAFVEGLLAGFIQDNRMLVERLEGSLLLFRFEEFKEILHAIKGSSVSIGAVSLRETCQRFEKMTHGELRRDAPQILTIVKSAFSQLCEALDYYRMQRNRTPAQK